MKVIRSRSRSQKQKWSQILNETARIQLGGLERASWRNSGRKHIFACVYSHFESLHGIFTIRRKFYHPKHPLATCFRRTPNERTVTAASVDCQLISVVVETLEWPPRVAARVLTRSRSPTLVNIWRHIHVIVRCANFADLIATFVNSVCAGDAGNLLLLRMLYFSSFFLLFECCIISRQRP